MDNILNNALEDSDTNSDTDSNSSHTKKHTLKNDNTNKNEDKQNAKRRVGRPCKTKTDIFEPICGIVNNPKDTNNAMELICRDPSIFKKIIGLLKNYQVQDVEFVFKPDTISIATQDHSKHTMIFTNFDCNNLYWYYLDKHKNTNKNNNDIHVCVARIDLDEIFNSIDKTYDTIMMWITHTDMNSKLNIRLHHVPHDNNQNFVVPIKVFKSTLNKPNTNTKNIYPIRFSISTKVFKQLIEKMSKLFTIITIKKESQDSSLTFESKIEHGKEMEVVFKNPEKIMLKDYTNPDDIISVDVMAEHINILSKTTMGDNVNIWIDNNEDILFQLTLSESLPPYTELCFIQVFTKTIGNNSKN